MIFVIGEIGINHNGDLGIAKDLIDVASHAGCDAVKFQKRTIEDVYSPENYKNDACAHPLTREKFRYLLNLGFTDTGKHFIEGSSNWTFWGYRGGGWQKGNGLRIDHFLTSSEITDLIKSVEINREPRGWDKASDHTPISIKI